MITAITILAISSWKNANQEAFSFLVIGFCLCMIALAQDIALIHLLWR